MARIAGVDLPREKRIEIGLTYIYGIGRATANQLLAEAGVNPDTRVRDITDDEVKKISEAIEKLGVLVDYVISPVDDIKNGNFKVPAPKKLAVENSSNNFPFAPLDDVIDDLPFN